jgi:myosin heavy chain 6/7
MLDMNDPEIIDSLKYLIIPQSEKIKFQAMPFDAKKQCFVADPKEGFVTAEIQSTKGEEVTVKTSKNEVIFRSKKYLGPSKFLKLIM